jgi:hypothetical protein|tara:strand:+ start:616 stop:876 length:261 start_codon:yes stop_codon:yes gene_type:complete
MTEKEKKLILLTDYIEQKVRKEKELEYYLKQLDKLKQKVYYLNQEINLTNLIIDMVNNESVVDIREQLLDKQQQNLLGRKKDDSET